MPLDVFCRIPSNPRQRDTEKHARKAVNRHLRCLSPTHCFVAIATMNGVPICKLDGHTRALLWQTGKLQKPDSELIVAAYDVASISEAAELYTHFDSSFAVEGSTDRLSGACRESGLHLRSPLLRGHNFNTSLKFAEHLGPGRACSEYELVPKWARVLKTVDDWQLPRNAFKGSGVVSLMFVAVASQLFSVDMLADFFDRYANNMGEKSGWSRDGVQALREHIDERRLKNQMTGYDNIFDMMSKGYSCLRAWSLNQMIRNVQPSREALIKLHAKAMKNLDSGVFAAETIGENQ